MKITKHIKSFALFSAFLFTCYTNFAEAKLLVTPTRVYLTDQKKLSEVRLMNQSSEVTTYRIEFVYQSMDENGKYSIITPITENSTQEEKTSYEQKMANKTILPRMIQYSPRQVTLQPGETQLVRFAMRRLEDAKPGEYNAHIAFKELDQGVDLSKSEETEKFAVRLKPLFNVVIPAFVVTGVDSKYKAAIQNTTFEKSTNTARFSIVNQGEVTPYGDIAIKFLDENNKVFDSKDGYIEIKGASIIKPLVERKFAIKYEGQTPEKISSIEITYKTQAEEGSKEMSKLITKI